MVRVMVFGTFDQLHPGHLHFLQQAKHLGDELYVVVAKDCTVTAVKGHAPVQPEEVRRMQVDVVPGVTRAVLGSAHDPYVAIRRYHPQVIGLGYDQVAFTATLPKIFPGIRMARISALHPERYKTSRRRTTATAAEIPLPGNEVRKLKNE